ncbi:MAG: hypothetical protein ABL888_06030 [Pirellulaceae bacterium]
MGERIIYLQLFHGNALDPYLLGFGITNTGRFFLKSWFSHSILNRGFICMFRSRLNFVAAMVGIQILISTCMFAQENTSVAALEKEITVLRKQLKETQRQLDQAIAAGFITTEDGFSSAVEILRTLPKELELNAKKPWDQTQRNDALDLLNQNAIGKPFRCKSVLSKVEIKENNAYVKDRTQPKYFVVVVFQGTSFPNQGLVISQNLSRPNGGFEFEGDEELVEKAKTLRAGKSYEVSGLIKKIEITGDMIDKTKFDVLVDLTRIEFEPLK